MILYALILLHLICDKLLIHQRHVELKTEKPEYIFLHAILYSLAFTAFMYGYTFNINRTLFVLLIIFLVKTTYDNIVAEIMLRYKQRYIEGSNIPNIGHESLNVIFSFGQFIATHFIFFYE